MHITQAAAKVRPGTTWNLRGDTLEQANDDAPRVSVPTQAELQPILDADAYKEKRQAEYPSLPDQLDAMWKFINAVPDAASKATQAQILAVKAKYPKPQ